VPITPIGITDTTILTGEGGTVSAVIDHIASISTRSPIKKVPSGLTGGSALRIPLASPFFELIVYLTFGTGEGKGSSILPLTCINNQPVI